MNSKLKSWVILLFFLFELLSCLLFIDISFPAGLWWGIISCTSFIKHPSGRNERLEGQTNLSLSTKAFSLSKLLVFTHSKAASKFGAAARRSACLSFESLQQFSLVWDCIRWILIFTDVLQAPLEPFHKQIVGSVQLYDLLLVFSSWVWSKDRRLLSQNICRSVGLFFISNVNELPHGPVNLCERKRFSP